MFVLGARWMQRRFVPTGRRATGLSTKDDLKALAATAVRRNRQSEGDKMKTFLALYTGSASQERPAPPNADTIAAGMAAWGAWMEKHAADVVVTGSPVGTTKKVSKDGVSDIHNAVAGFIVVQAETPEAAAKMFEGHPHFAIFPGEAVEVMECLPIPGA
jgi:hypothetical protein